MNLKNLIPSVIVPVLVSVALSAVTARAASQTWTNAPVSQIWTNAGNWVGQAYPGAQSQTGNSINNDLATFNTPIPLSGIGGASAPIMIPGSPVITTTNRCLTVGGILFDTVNCGAYVFQTNQPTQYPSNGILYVSHNNSITISPTVTNSQTFLIPVFIRLPSSTAGIYNFINNASSPAVTLFFNSVTNDSATSRGTVFTLGGSNTGTNTIALLSKGTTTSGGMGLNKIGTGRWLLPNASDLASQSVNTINDGTLEVQNAGSLGVPVGTTINSNGVLQVDNITLNQGFFSLQRNGTYRLNGSGTVSNFNIGTAIGGITTPRVATTSSGDVLTVNAVTNGASDATVHIIGPGTVVLGAGATPYIGNWSFDAGKTVVTNASALGTGGLASVGPGAVLDLTALGASWTPTVGALGGTGSSASGSLAATITAASGATINLVNKGVTITFTPTGFSGDLTHPSFILSAGNLSIGTTTFTIDNASGTPLGVGTYLIAQQSSGSISDAGSHVVLMNGSGVQFGTIGTIQTSGGNLYLVVIPYTSRPLSWKGGNPNSTWDTVIKNWWDGIQYTNFNTSDYATFDAVGATNPVVNIPGTVVPTTLVVNTAATNYTFSGTGLIGGNASLTKMSSGTLTLATVNSYIGGTTISNGTIKVGANNALPASGTLTFVNNTATLDLNGFNDALGSITGNGIIDNNNGAAASTLTLGSDGSSGTFSGVIQSSSNNIQVVKTGTGVTTLNGANTYSGTNTVNNGTLAVTGTSALGNPTNNLVVNSGILSLGANVTVGSVTGAGNIENDANATTAFLTLGSPVASSFSGVISDGSGGGAVGVRIVNGASLSFSANFNGYSGGTYVGTNSTFTIQNGPAGVGGFLVASNGASLNLAGGSSTPGTPTNILTVDGATISLGSGALGKIWTGQFQGAANTTNRVLNTMSFGGDSSFKNFNGVVSLEQVGSARFLNVPTGSFGGGDAATFLFVNSGAT
ncbi:MAG TPA: autotransporter-associated beta strand repeat-containing protein, partial [Verrucomicrobiae bacterium]|nr:autotransporter-associated beta strand repeat-containing protein [Verrucomicrobiae bacterium]